MRVTSWSSSLWLLGALLLGSTQARAADPTFTWKRPASLSKSQGSTDVQTAADMARRVRLVHLDACANGKGFDYEWSARAVVDGRTGAPFPMHTVSGTSSRDCKVDWVAPFEGEFEVELAVSDWLSTFQTRQRVLVRDIWLASIGDSYSSGEGNPDNDTLESPYGYYSWRSALCHRSHRSWPFMVARSVQAAYPEAQILFSHLACSGASIDSGLLGGYGGVGGGGNLPPQVQVLSELRTETGPHPANPANTPGRQYVNGPYGPDVLMMSIGGNDVSFSSAVVDCLVFGCASDWNNNLHPVVQQKLSELPLKLEGLASELDGQLGNRTSVVVAEYFDATRDEDGDFSALCLSGATATAGDLEWAYESIIRPLNKTIQSVATTEGWRFAGGIESAFRTHGICSSSSWLRSVEESLVLQDDHRGAFHPNLRGHEEAADRVLPAVMDVLDGAEWRVPELRVRASVSGLRELQAQDVLQAGDFVRLYPAANVGHTVLLDGQPYTGQALSPAQGYSSSHVLTVQSSYSPYGAPAIPLPERTYTLEVRDDERRMMDGLLVQANVSNQLFPVSPLAGSNGFYEAGTYLTVARIHVSHGAPDVSLQLHIKPSGSPDSAYVPYTSGQETWRVGDGVPRNHDLRARMTSRGVTTEALIRFRVVDTYRDIFAAVPEYTLYTSNSRLRTMRYDAPSVSYKKWLEVGSGNFGAFLQVTAARDANTVSRISVEADGVILPPSGKYYFHSGETRVRIYACYNPTSDCTKPVSQDGGFGRMLIAAEDIPVRSVFGL